MRVGGAAVVQTKGLAVTIVLLFIIVFLHSWQAQAGTISEFPSIWLILLDPS